MKTSAIGMFLLGAVFAAAATAREAAAHDRMRNMEQQFATFVNQERQKAGLKPVKVHEALQEAAASYVLTLAQDEVPCPPGHTNRGKEDFSYIAAHGYQSGNGGTCVHGIPKGYMGYNDPANYMFYDAKNGWMNSSGHKANILGASFTEMGAGVYRSDKGTYYALLMFASPSSNTLHFQGTILNARSTPTTYYFVTKAGRGQPTILQPGQSIAYDKESPTLPAFIFEGSTGQWALPVRNGIKYVVVDHFNPQTKQMMLLATASEK